MVVFKSSPDTGYRFNTAKLIAVQGDCEEFDVGKKATKAALTSPPGTIPDVEETGLVGCGKVYTLCAHRSGSVPKKRNDQTITSSTPDTERTIVETKDREDLKISHDFISIGSNVKYINIKPADMSPKTPGQMDPTDPCITKTAGYTPLEVDSFNGVFSTKLDGKLLGRTNEEREFRRLVFDVGLEPGNARMVIKQAADTQKPSKYLVKLAASYRIGAVESMADDPEIAQVQAEVPIRTEESVLHTQGTMLNDVKDAAIVAVETDNKDLFDVATLEGLLKIKQNVGFRRESFLRFLKGMDECGRSLFRLFWNREDLVESIGLDSVRKYEDALVENFNSLGSLVLFQQTKLMNIHGPFENSLEGSLVEDEDDAIDL